MILWRSNPETQQIEKILKKTQHLPNLYKCGLVIYQLKIERDT